MATRSAKPAGPKQPPGAPPGTVTDGIAAAEQHKVGSIAQLREMSAYLRQMAQVVEANLVADVRKADTQLRVGRGQGSALGSRWIAPVGPASSSASGLAGRAAKVGEDVIASLQDVARGLKATAGAVDKIAAICKTAADGERLSDVRVNQLLSQPNTPSKPVTPPARKKLPGGRPHG